MLGARDQKSNGGRRKGQRKVKTGDQELERNTEEQTDRWSGRRGDTVAKGQKRRKI